MQLAAPAAGGGKGAAMAKIAPAGRLILSAAMLKIIVLALAGVAAAVAAIVHQHGRVPEPMFVPVAPAPSATEIPAPELETQP
jgi:hypothetical protein